MLNSPFPLLVAIGAALLLALTGNLLVAEPLIIAVQLAAVALSFWARRSFQDGSFRVAAAPGGSTVIQDGPYRFIRHPMYAAALLLLSTAIMGHPSLFTAGVWAVVALTVLLRIGTEEAVLRAALPGYEAYSRTTRKLVPFVY